MPAETVMDLEYYNSIQKIFKARDEKQAQEAARMRAEASAGRSTKGSTQTGTKRASYTSASRGAARPYSNGGRRLEQPVRRTHLEATPERDEFSPRRGDDEIQRVSARPSRREIQEYSKDAEVKRKGGAHLDTSNARQRRGAHYAKDNADNSGAKAFMVGLAGVGSALLVVFNAILGSAPADVPAANAANNTQPLPDGIYEQAGDEEARDIIKTESGEFVIDYDSAPGEIDTNVEVPLDEVQNPEDAAPPYVPIEHVSDNLIDAMKTFEGLHLEAYVCPGGALTIGYGHTADVYAGQTITLDEAKELLRQDLASCEKKVREYAAEHNVQLTQGQFDAFVDFAYNLGKGCFEESGLVEMIGEGDLDGAAAHMNEYVWAKDKDTGEMVKLGGLVTRRATEVEWLYS